MVVDSAVPLDLLTRVRVVRIRAAFCAGVDDGSCCQPATFNALVTVAVDNCTGGNPALMNPLLASVIQRGVHRQSVQALSPAVTNNRITGCSPSSTT